jgi:hypothetical protein
MLKSLNMQYSVDSPSFMVGTLSSQQFILLIGNIMHAYILNLTSRLTYNILHKTCWTHSQSCLIFLSVWIFLKHTSLM